MPIPPTRQLTQAPNRPKPRRRISRDALHALAGAVRREWDRLPPDSPRVRPTMPRLAFLRRDGEIGGFS
jgi:hypothetical protein